MNKNQNNESIPDLLDFEEWSTLARSDPESFEKKRLETIELFFTSVPEEKRRRLRGLQWQVDQTRQLTRTPMAACIAISNMMWDSLHRLSIHQRELQDLTSGQPAACTTHEQVAATILPFQPR